MGLWDKIKSIFIKEKKLEMLPAAPEVNNEETDKDKRNSFKEEVQTYENPKLTKEQMILQMAQTLGIDKETLKISAYKEALVEMFKEEIYSESDIEKCEKLCKMTNKGKTNECKEISLFDRNDNVKKQILIQSVPQKNLYAITEVGFEKSFFNMLGQAEDSTIHIHKTIRVFDKSTDVEVSRDVKQVNQKGDRVEEVLHRFSYRDNSDLDRAYNIEYDVNTGKVESKDEIDLTKTTRDISTLDGVDEYSQYGYINNTDIFYMNSYRNNYKQDEKKQLMECIKRSKNAKGCYKYAGIEDPEKGR